ncbi:MAG: hypothetical protein J6J66_03970, partial [Clostridia bacterium]|nr:hypothetical protein [Clostridia bacterium]
FAIRAGYFGAGYKLNWNVNGGSLTVGTFYQKNLTIERAGSLTLGKGSDGQPLHVICAADQSGSIKYTDLNGTVHYFGATSTDGVSYTHIPMSLTTPYGDIPSNRLSVLAYPFVAFADNGDGTYTYKTASANFFTDGGMEYTMRSVANGIILLRRDFTVTTTISNLSNNPGRLTVDLGGHTLTTGGATASVTSEAKHATETRVIFRNGTVLLDKSAFISFIGTVGTGKTFVFTLQDLTFRYAEGTAVKSPTEIGSTGVDYALSVTYENCIFDLTEYQPSAVTLISAVDASGKVTLSVTVIGGTVKAASIKGISLSDAPRALSHRKNGEGKYVSFDVPIRTDVPRSQGVALIDWGFGMKEYWAIGAKASHADVLLDQFFTYSYAPFTVEGDCKAEKTLALAEGTVQMSLTLQSQIGVNLYFAEALSGATIKYAGAEIPLATLVAADGFYKLSDAIAPNVADQVATVTVVIGENEHVLTVGIGAYAKAVLASEDYADVHKLTYAMVEYVRSMVESDFLAGVGAPDGYEAQVVDTEKLYNKGENVLLNAISFNLSGTIEIAIEAGEAEDGAVVTLTLASGRTVTATIEGGVASFAGLYINEFYGDLTISVGDETYSYCIENYHNAMGAEHKAAIAALYTYAYYAVEYVATLQ